MVFQVRMRRRGGIIDREKEKKMKLRRNCKFRQRKKAERKWLERWN